MKRTKFLVAFMACVLICVSATITNAQGFDIYHDGNPTATHYLKNPSLGPYDLWLDGFTITAPPATPDGTYVDVQVQFAKYVVVAPPLYIPVPGGWSKCWGPELWEVANGTPVGGLYQSLTCKADPTPSQPNMPGYNCHLNLHDDDGYFMRVKARLYNDETGNGPWQYSVWFVPVN